MGKLIYTRLGRIMMAAAMLNVAWSAIWGFPYPASLKDGAGEPYAPTHILVAPVPILQIINLVLGGFGVVNEFSKPWNRFMSTHHARFLQNILLRCVFDLMVVGFAIMQFQTSQACPYLLIGTGIYLRGYFSGERLDASGIGQSRRERTSHVVHAIA